MVNLVAAYRNLRKFTEAEKLEIQAQELKRRVPGAEFSHGNTTMANIQEAQEVQALDASSTIPGEENFHPIQVLLNHPVQAVVTEL